MSKLRIRKDDQVIVIAGKEKGKTGKVLRTEPKKNRVYVEGLNMLKRHQRPRTMEDAKKGDEGGIIEREGPINASNVMLIDPDGNKPTRVRIERTEDGKRRRIAARSGKQID
ncbi:MAG: 50S ribosomal protein L24 [bacterium]